MSRYIVTEKKEWLLLRHKPQRTSSPLTVNFRVKK